MLRQNTKGVTLVEAFLASLIFVISVSAIFVAMSSVRKPVINNEQEVQVALIARDVLEDLRSKIDTRDFTDGYLKVGEHPPEPTPPTMDSLPTGYTMSYDVTLDPTSCADPTTASCGRKVDLSVNWPDTIN